MFNIGMSEFIVLGAIALIFIGPKQLPEVARTVGRLLNEMKRVSEEVFGSFSDIRTNARKFMEDTEKQITKDILPQEPDVPPPPVGTHGQHVRPYNFTLAEDKVERTELVETEETTEDKPHGKS